MSKHKNDNETIKKIENHTGLPYEISIKLKETFNLIHPLQLIYQLCQKLKIEFPNYEFQNSKEYKFQCLAELGLINGLGVSNKNKKESKRIATEHLIFNMFKNDDLYSNLKPLLIKDYNFISENFNVFENKKNEKFLNKKRERENDNNNNENKEINNNNNNDNKNNDNNITNDNNDNNNNSDLVQSEDSVNFFKIDYINKDIQNKIDKLNENIENQKSSKKSNKSEIHSKEKENLKKNISLNEKENVNSFISSSSPSKNDENSNIISENKSEIKNSFEENNNKIKKEKNDELKSSLLNNNLISNKNIKNNNNQKNNNENNNNQLEINNNNNNLNNENNSSNNLIIQQNQILIMIELFLFNWERTLLINDKIIINIYFFIEKINNFIVSLKMNYKINKNFYFGSYASNTLRINQIEIECLLETEIKNDDIKNILKLCNNELKSNEINIDFKSDKYLNEYIEIKNNLIVCKLFFKNSINSENIIKHIEYIKNKNLNISQIISIKFLKSWRRSKNLFFLNSDLIEFIIANKQEQYIYNYIFYFFNLFLNEKIDENLFSENYQKKIINNYNENKDNIEIMKKECKKAIEILNSGNLYNIF